MKPTGFVFTASLAVILVALIACATPTATAVSNETASTGTLVLGDGHVSTSPRVGYVFSCQTSFGGGGASASGPWIIGSTWDPALKPSIQGSVSWPNARITITREGDERVVRANNLPDHTTGTFPVQASDPAYQYDRNPNTIREQDVLLTLPATPSAAGAPSCVPMGMIGFARSGAAIYNALDAGGRDAVAHEIQDHCSGHPQQAGQYHYHSLSACFADAAVGAHSALVGYARDGYGIYGPKGEGGKTLKNEDLDACHGHEHVIDWDGVPTRLYHYHTTAEYPYTVGCYHGTL
jgi:hypothetical protein